MDQKEESVEAQHSKALQSWKALPGVILQPKPIGHMYIYIYIYVYICINYDDN